MNISAYSGSSPYVPARPTGGSGTTIESPTQRVNEPVSGSGDVSRDSVTLSDQGKELAKTNGTETQQTSSAPGADSVEDQTSNLSEEELRQLQKLKARDAEVRTHEQAHLSVAGSYAKGSASFTMQKGPDGNSYAVGGEVGIDLGAESTPEATIEKMRTIRRAALAPANPSGADRRIAAQASAKEAQARQEQMVINQEELLSAANDANNVDETTTIPHISSGPSHSTLKAGLAAYGQFAQQ